MHPFDDRRPILVHGAVLRAFGDYTEALRLNPAYARAYYNRGLAHVQAGSLARALDDFDAAIQLSPDYAKALASRAILLAGSDSIDEALADFEKLEASIAEILGFNFV